MNKGLPVVFAAALILFVFGQALAVVDDRR
jgi:hypothetical protein